MTAAMEGAVEEALARIDMRRHEGQHPRIGAVDVIPFVPLGDTTMDECVTLARDFGARIAQRFDLPVYLYARAAQRPEREVLADIRRPQFEGLRELISTPEYAPDFGPARAASDRRRSRRRRAAIPDRLQHQPRERRTSTSPRRSPSASASAPAACRAFRRSGLFLDDLNCAQVSMNLLDFSITPMWRVWEAVRDAAAEQRRRAARIRADRPRADPRADGRRRPHRRRPATVRRASASRAPRTGSRSAISSRRWRSRSAWQRPSETAT